MQDNITPGALQPGMAAYAGYVGGHWPTYAGLLKQFPGKPILSIAVTAAQNAEVLDDEPGDATNAQAPGWWRAQRARGLDIPVIYTSASNAQALVNTMAAAGIPRNAYWLWTAHYNFRSHICGPGCGFGLKTTADGTQWTDRAPGGNDESTVSTAFLLWITSHTPGAVPPVNPNPTPAPPAPTPTNQGDQPVFVAHTTDTKAQYLVFETGKVSHIASAGFGSALTAAKSATTLGLPYLECTQADIDAIVQAA